MTGKIERIYSVDIEKVNEGLGSSGLKYEYTTNRFASFILDLDDLIRDPILGRGINDQTRYLGHYNIKRTNGLSDLILRLGILLFALYTLGIYATGSKLSKENNNKAGGFFLIAIIFTVSFAEPILYTPYLFAITMYSLKSTE